MDGDIERKKMPMYVQKNAILRLQMILDLEYVRLYRYSLQCYLVVLLSSPLTMCVKLLVFKLVGLIKHRFISYEKI